jgi:hypothetical protein
MLDLTSGVIHADRPPSQMIFSTLSSLRIVPTGRLGGGTASRFWSRERVREMKSR